MNRLLLFLALISTQGFAYDQLISCSGKDVSLNIWTFPGSKNVEIKINDKSFDAKRSDIENGRALLIHDDSNHPWVYETYLEKTNGSWKINKYWLCLGYYFEERGCINDELRLENSTVLSCI